MSSNPGKYGLFEVFGIELEYMIVDRESLTVRPITDLLFKHKCGEIVSDVPNGEIEWSNELVSHVVELKTNGPSAKIDGLETIFLHNITEINRLLEKEQAMLLPTAAHPLMDPFSETQLWQHEHNEVYALYNRIFDCKGHGWSNLQSTHINLPFRNDEEFGKLHAAIRLLLPIIPALSASSPLFDGRLTGYCDSRMEAYLHNQEKIPVLMGSLVPEQVFSEKAYHEKIFQPIIQAIRPYDTEKVMDHFFLNSRGAIARFDRGAIEIRVIDIQECPLADIAITSLIIGTAKALVSEQWGKLEQQQSWHESDLFSIFQNVIKHGEQAVIQNPDYLQLFGLNENKLKAGQLWQQIYTGIQKQAPKIYHLPIEQLLKHGTLSSRIIRSLNDSTNRSTIIHSYKTMADCLAQNRLFIP